MIIIKGKIRGHEKDWLVKTTFFVGLVMGFRLWRWELSLDPPAFSMKLCTWINIFNLFQHIGYINIHLSRSIFWSVMISDLTSTIYCMISFQNHNQKQQNPWFFFFFKKQRGLIICLFNELYVLGTCIYSLKSLKQHLFIPPTLVLIQHTLAI